MAYSWQYNQNITILCPFSSERNALDILCIGLFCCDIMVRPVQVESLLAHEAVHVGPIRFATGGDASNVAANTVALGLRSALVSATGRDEAGEMIRRRMAEAGVDCSYLRYVDNRSTCVAIALVDNAGQRRFISSLDVLVAVTPEFISDDMLARTRALFMGSAFRLPGLDDGGIAPVFEKARKLGVLTAFDTKANRSPVAALDRLAKTLAHADLVLPSYDEAVEITGETDVRAMREVMSRFPIQWFAVKLGGDGCYITDFKKEYRISAFPVNPVIDTTGAGDSFVSGLLYARLAGRSMVESAIFANAVAAHKVAHFGATGGVPDAGSIERFLERNREHIVVK